jgi:hypothetical protein
MAHVGPLRECQDIMDPASACLVIIWSPIRRKYVTVQISALTSIGFKKQIRIRIYTSMRIWIWEPSQTNADPGADPGRTLPSLKVEF